VRIYLDNCCFNRPFDDQGSIRVRLETEAKLHIQECIRVEEVELVWSYMMDYENERNPFDDRRGAIAAWKRIAAIDVEESAAVLARSMAYARLGLRPKDALHTACAVEARCERLITTDDAFAKKAKSIREIRVVDPLLFVREVNP
jgi:predicted nucleic acid-binding protein